MYSWYFVLKKSMPLLIVTWCLLLYGILALFSVSVHESFTTTLSLISKWKLDGDPSNYFFFFKQVKNFIYVAIVAYITYLAPLHIFKNRKFLTVFSILVFVLQLLVFTPWWASYGWAKWWLDLPWFPSIQPVEFFKLWYIIFLSRWLMRKEHLLNSKDILKKFFSLHIILFFIFLMIPDLWWILLMGITGFIMAIYAWVNIKNMLRMMWFWAVIVFVGLRSLLKISDTFCSAPNPEDRPSVCRYTYLTNRVKVFIDSEEDKTGRNISWQNRQAIIAIWWGWFWGKWYGKWLQKFWYIPEAQSDFIFSAYAEEVGFFGIMILFGLYIALVYFVLMRIPFVRDPYFKLLSVGLISMIIVQVFVHIWVNTQLIPNTWLTLPFISYWWTALMTNIMSIILLYKILYQSSHKL